MNTPSSLTSRASLKSLQALVVALVVTSALVLVGSPARATALTTPVMTGTALSPSSDNAATIQTAPDEATRDASAQAVVIEPAREVKTVWTSEFGVAHPAGLAYDPARATFFVAGTARAGTELLRLDNRGRGFGIVPTPQLRDPATFSFDGGEDRLVTVSDRVSSIIVRGGDLVSSPRPAGQPGRHPDLGTGTIGSSSFDPGDGAWILLDTDSNTLVRVSRSQVVTRLVLPDLGAPELIAVNPADGLLYVMSPRDGIVYALDSSASVHRAFSTAGIALQSPVAMTFAPSTDTTDDPAIYNLYIADAGGPAINGGVTEVSLMAVHEVAAATVDTSTLVRMTATSGWSPGSPDPSGVVWMPATDRIVVVDSEVDETTGAGWHDVNMWFAQRNGSVASTGTTWGNNAALFAGSRGYSREVTGAGFDPAGNVLYLSDDDARKIFVVRPGPDGLFGNLDDVVTAIDVVPTGSIDTEDPAYEPASGHLFFLDGSNKEIYEIDPVDGIFGNGNDTSSHFDIGYLGPSDWEGLTFDSTRGSLFVGARTTKQVFEISLDGTHLRTIDVSGISGLQYISGLEIAPSSTGSGVPNLWIVDRGVDNNPSPSENDGRLFEIAIAGSELDTLISSGPNGPVATDSATFTFTATVPSATFQCSLDAAPFTGCVTPKTYSGLAEGVHEFQVRAVNAGIPDSTPATRSWSVDTTPPDTTITAAPPASSGSASATFEFTASEPGSTFACSLDGAAATACTSPWTYEALQNGAHSFAVAATDLAGNPDVTPAVVNWTVDALPVNTLTLSPLDDSYVVASASGSNFGGAATLVSDGSPVSVVYLKFDLGALAGADVQSAVLEMTVESKSVGVQSVRGVADVGWTEGTITFNNRPLVGAVIGSFTPDVARQTVISVDVGSWVAAHAGLVGSLAIDSTSSDGYRFSSSEAASGGVKLTVVHGSGGAPETSITSGPPLLSGSAAATFGFTATVPSATFECSLDAAPFAGCVSPKTYSGLVEGVHEFRVRAVDAGVPDSSPATRSWTVDTTPPDTSVTGSPPSESGSGSATFEFTASEPGSTFECSLDGVAATACVSPVTYTGLADGAHSFAVAARDSAGNLDASPATHAWTVTTSSAPETSIASGPPLLSGSASATFEFDSSPSGGTFSCVLDGAVPVGCLSPVDYSGLADGVHDFSVVATVGGQTDPSPATWSWTVDTTPPDTSVTGSPPSESGSGSATFEFTASEPGSTFECSLDGVAATACVSPVTYTGLADGAHSFAVAARDSAGNLDASPATHAWTVSLPAGGTLTLSPLDDSYVVASASGSNFGGAATLVSDGSPVSVVYLKFDLGALAGADVQSAVLEMTVESKSVGVQSVRGVADVGWTEGTITFNNRPLVGAVIGSFTPDVARQTVISVDVGSWVAAHAGLVGSLAIDSTSSDGYRFSSSEAASGGVKLTVVHGSGGAPETSITSGPPLLSGSAAATFGFTATVPSATFECSLDAAPFAGCVSPKTYSGLVEGVHEFRVRAVDAGVPDSSPATRSWTVDTTPPDTSVTGSPPSESGSGSATFEFTASEPGSTFECSLDGVAATACVSPVTYTGLADGAHSFAVAATDLAGNPDVTPAVVNWTVDALPTNTVSLSPIDDSYVVASASGSNFGGAATLVSDGSPVSVVYLKFDLGALAGADVQSAVLEMTVESKSVGVQSVRGVADVGWTEGTITFNNRPAVGAVIGSFTPDVARQTVISVDVGSWVAAHAGLVGSLAIDSTSSDGYRFSSSEAASGGVKLTITYVQP